MNTVELERLVVRLVGDTSKFVEPFKEAQGVANKLFDSLGGVEGILRTVIGRFINFGDIVQGVLTRVSGQLTVLGAALSSISGFSLYQSIFGAGGYEQTQIAFETLIGDATESQKTLNRLLNFADITPFSDHDILAAGRSMIQFGERGDELMETLNDVGNAAAGASTDFGMLALIVNQVRGTGRLLRQDFYQLSTRGVLSLQDIAKHFKITREEADQMITAGKVGFKDIKAIFHDMSQEGGRFANLMERQSQTFLGLWETAKGYILVIMREIGVSILPIIKPILNLFISLAKAFEALPAWVKTAAAAVLLFVFAMGAAATAIGGFLLLIFPVMAAISTMYWHWGMLQLAIGLANGKIQESIVRITSYNGVTSALGRGLSNTIDLLKQGVRFLGRWTADWATAAIGLRGFETALKAVMFFAPAMAAGWLAWFAGFITGWESLTNAINSVWDQLVMLEAYVTAAWAATIVAPAITNLTQGLIAAAQYIGLFNTPLSMMNLLINQVRTEIAMFAASLAAYGAKGTAALIVTGSLVRMWKIMAFLVREFAGGLAVMAVQSTFQWAVGISKLNEEIAANSRQLQVNVERTREFVDAQLEALGKLKNAPIEKQHDAAGQTLEELQKKAVKLRARLANIYQQQDKIGTGDDLRQNGFRWYQQLGAWVYDTTSAYDQLGKEAESVNEEIKLVSKGIEAADKIQEETKPESLTQANAKKWEDFVKTLQEEGHELDMNNRKLTEREKIMERAARDHVTGEGLEVISGALGIKERQQAIEDLRKSEEAYAAQRSQMRTEGHQFATDLNLSLQEQIDTFGMTAQMMDEYRITQELTKAGLEHAIPHYVAMNEELHHQAAALKEVEEAKQREKEAWDQANQIVESVMTPYEKYIQELGRLAGLQEKMDEVSFERALKAATNEFMNAADSVEHLNSEMQNLYGTFLENSAVRAGSAELRKMQADMIMSTSKAQKIREAKELMGFEQPAEGKQAAQNPLVAHKRQEEINAAWARIEAEQSGKRTPANVQGVIDEANRRREEARKRWANTDEQNAWWQGRDKMSEGAKSTANRIAELNKEREMRGKETRNRIAEIKNQKRDEGKNGQQMEKLLGRIADAVEETAGKDPLELEGANLGEI